MRLSKAICLAIALAVGTSHLSMAAEQPVEPAPGVTEELIAWSAADFSASGPRPSQVRNVHLRYAVDKAGTRSTLLCGEFLAAGEEKPEWTDFATIKTDPYEQWIGNMARSQCEHATAVAANAEDLSARLQQRLDATAKP